MRARQCMEEHINSVELALLGDAQGNLSVFSSQASRELSAGPAAVAHSIQGLGSDGTEIR